MSIGEVIDRLKVEAESRGLDFRAEFADDGAPGQCLNVSATDFDDLGSFSMSVANGEFELCLRVFAAALMAWKGRAWIDVRLAISSEAIPKREDGTA